MSIRLSGSFVGVLIAIVLSAAPCRAQSARSIYPLIAPRGSVVFTPISEPELAAARMGTGVGHGTTGAIVGAGVLGLTGAILMHSACDTNEPCTGSTIGGALVGAVVGAVVGAFIGSSIH